MYNALKPCVTFSLSEWRSSLKGMETSLRYGKNFCKFFEVRMEVFPERDGNWEYGVFRDFVQFHYVRMEVFPERDGNEFINDAFACVNLRPNGGLP